MIVHHFIFSAVADDLEVCEHVGGVLGFSCCLFVCLEHRISQGPPYSGFPSLLKP